MTEGSHVFAPRPDGQYARFVFGVVTGVDGDRMGINGVVVDPVGLKNKVAQDKAGVRSAEVLKNPTAENCIHALIFRVEHDSFTGVLDMSQDKVEIIPPKVHSNLDGWIREDLPELINNVLSLPQGVERDAAKRTLRQKMDTLLDRNLKRNLYSVCRSLKILN
ncbi:hypothetical protein GBAR_LOCUS21860 [Geodia barretti]|jgi:hypothetical protein|uniref:Uncharacterized protein n=1 Tax=Geodia barretti TaxID=519541 RepID=A0AA35T1L3_GEOBA|nr:hypothetical protein GBAR_LOCUS21860 [Geodia barretti]